MKNIKENVKKMINGFSMFILLLFFIFNMENKNAIEILITIVVTSSILERYKKDNVTLNLYTVVGKISGIIVAKIVLIDISYKFIVVLILIDILGTIIHKKTKE